MYHIKNYLIGGNNNYLNLINYIKAIGIANVIQYSNVYYKIN